MKPRFSAEDEAFRRDVRQYLRANLPVEIAAKVRHGQPLTRADYMLWQDVLARRNWYAIGWPKKVGGPGLSLTQRYLFEQEHGGLHTPRVSQFGIAMAGPVIYTFGSEAQKARFLPGIRENKTFWCQGYSEPNAGSDLAALATTAVRDGSDYVVSGQKTWTTWANWADWMFCLVKTDLGVRAQLGISFLLIDMRSPGITVRPIRTLDGDTEFNEVFLDDVRVPIENRIGEEGRGWSYAKFLLEHERFSMSEAARSRRVLRELMQEACDLGAQDDGVLTDRLKRLEIRLLALEHMELGLLARLAGGENPGPEASKLKIRGTEIAQALSRLRIDLHEGACLTDRTDAPLDASAMGALGSYLNQRKLTIWGGSNEVQRMVLAKHLLGLA